MGASWAMAYPAHRHRRQVVHGSCDSHAVLLRTDSVGRLEGIFGHPALSLFRSYQPRGINPSIMDAAATLSTFYLIAAAAFGAVLASLSIALYASRARAWDWLYATALRKIRRDSLRSEGTADRPRRSR